VHAIDVSGLDLLCLFLQVLFASRIACFYITNININLCPCDWLIGCGSFFMFIFTSSVCFFVCFYITNININLCPCD